MKALLKMAYKSDEPIDMKEIHDEVARREGSLTSDIEGYNKYLTDKFEFHSIADLKKAIKRQTGE